MNLQSQDLDQHRWENRLIIMLFDDFDYPDLKEQLNEFGNHKPGLQERKVLVYQITPGKFKQGLDDQDKWVMGDDKLFSKYKSHNSAFELLLIGLDGGVKLRERGAVSCKEIFRTIDSMPMRMREMERQRLNRNQQ